MFDKLKNKFYYLYVNTINSIAFIPTLVCIGYILMVILLLTIHSTGAEYKILKFIPFAEIESANTARTVLSSTLTGIISLTVFSFSMVMVVINQASSNYSPKVIGGLINDRSNQYILGIYIGTILYLLITLMQVENYNKFSVPHIAIFVGILTSLYCIILFVKFIHNISTTIQIFKIVDRIYIRTKEKMESENKKHEQTPSTEPQTKHWFTYTLPTSGYFQKIIADKLKSITSKNDLILKLEINYGTYYVENTPLFSLNKQITDKGLIEKIKGAFVFYTGENIENSPFYGFRQLREVAVKALSPGINDPGVAVLCLNRMTSLFVLLMKNDLYSHLYDEKGSIRVIVNTYNFEELLQTALLPIRYYGRKDVMVLATLLDLLKNLSHHDTQRKYQSLLNEYVIGVMEEAQSSIDHSQDKKFMADKIKSLVNLQGGYFSFSETVRI